MTDEVENLSLEHLKPIQAELSRVREEQRSAYSGQLAVQETLNAHSTLLQQCIEDIGGLRVRLDRIERRLELADAPTS